MSKSVRELAQDALAKVGCGRTTGHGDSCAKGWTCSACGELEKLATAVLSQGWVKCSDRLPTKSGVYPACSTIKGRSCPSDWVEALYMFEAEAKPGECKWQHSSGFYDNGVTHWLELSVPSHD